MIFTKKALLPLFFSVIAAIPLFVLVNACDDSASESNEDEINQIEPPIQDLPSEEIMELRKKYSWIVPTSWTRSERAYSSDDKDGYIADAFVKTWQQNWQGKNLYLARNFKDKDGKLLCEEKDEKGNVNIIFYFDNKDSCQDGYYIYLNTLPVESAASDDD